MAEWHYQGNFGSLGPLKEDQMQELIEAGVIESTTMIWRVGLSTWIQAKNDPALLGYFRNAPVPAAVPPPLPSEPVPFTPGPPQNVPPAVQQMPVEFSVTTVTTYSGISDKSRVLAGILNFVPGLGRLYLGYSAIGALQLFLALCGFGVIWSWVDGVAILLGSCRTDGYGRQLNP